MSDTAPATDDSALHRKYLVEFLGLYFHDPAVGILRAAEAHLIASETLAHPLLDLGCGDGSFARRTLAQPATVGIDRDFSRARRARASGAYESIVVADAHRLPFRDGSFASVLTNSTLEHIPAVESVLREAARVLHGDGRLLMTVHNDRFGEQSFFWPALFRMCRMPGLAERHRRRRRQRLAMVNLFSAAEWRQLLADAGFETETTCGYLRGRQNRAFERLLVLARFGIGRVHIGGALRVLDRVLVAAGITVHRCLAGRALTRALAHAATDRTGEPAALLLAARRWALPASAVVNLHQYRQRW